MRNFTSPGLVLASLAALAAFSGVAAMAPETKPTFNQKRTRPESALAKAQTVFAFDLIKTLGRDENANVVISPASAAGALSVIEHGANDELQKSIYSTLRLPRDSAKNTLAKLRTATANEAKDGPLWSANGLVIDRDLKANKATLQKVKDSKAEVTEASFATTEARDRANAWVNDKTKGKISKILDDLPSDAALIALNALYFKDKWQQPFDKELTKKAPFTKLSGDKVDVNAMTSRLGYYQFKEDDTFIAVNLPFEHKQYSLTLMTTKGQPRAIAGFDGARAWLSGTGFAAFKGQVSFPKLALSADLDVKPTLNAMSLIDTGLDHFAGRSLRLAAARQRVEFKVDEEGAEAAAATAITTTRSLQTDVKSFNADRPFMFALRDNDTGLILVAGYIAEPKQ